MWNPKEHSDEENLRWAYLRAVEWASWPAFVTSPFVPLALVFISWPLVIGSLVALNILWAMTVRYRFVSTRAAAAGVFVALLRWLTCPAACLYLCWTGAWGIGLLALCWPSLAGVVAAIPPSQIGVLQKQFMMRLGYAPRDILA
jgi:hypothetical protein